MLSQKLGLVFYLVCLINFGVCWSQTNTPPNIEAIGDQFYCPLSQLNIVTNFNIIDPDDTEIEAFHVQISTGYVIGQDRLILPGLHPNIIATWDNGQGKLSLRGVGGIQVAYVDVITAVNDIVFESNSVNVSGEKHFSFTIGNANYLPSTDHYYEYVQDIGITWTQAKVDAESRTYFGIQGYLATITSAEESQLSGEQAAGAGWIGGSDEQTEGVWKWMTGPEAGLTFWNGGINGTTPNYANWNTGEPNSAGNEDYAHITAPGIGINGSWNDLSNTGASNGPYQPKGYIVEYGGTPGDPIVDISASTKVSVAEIVSTVNAEQCDAGSLILEASASSGTVVWFDTLTGGVQLGTGLTFTTPIINVTTTYYAIASVNGCLDGVRIPVVATIKVSPSITTVTGNLVCESGSGVLSASASQGSINWYATAFGGAILGTGFTFTTPVLNATTVYYAEAEFDGCLSSRVPVSLTIQNTAAPTGNTVQTFCDIEGAIISDIGVTGSNIVWYSSSSGGNTLNTTDVLNTATYYASQTINGCESPTRFAVNIIVYNTVDIPQATDIPDLQECDTALDGDDANGFSQFDLNHYDTLILNGSPPGNFTIRYFTDALYFNQIMNPAVFVNTTQNRQEVYVRVFNNIDGSCYTDTSFNIQVDELPNVQSNFIFKNCDEDGIVDGFTDYNLTEVNDVITNGNTANLTITYYLNLSDAETASNAINPVPFNNATSNTVYARIENTNGCFRVSTINLQVSTTSFAPGYLQELEHCDDDEIIDGLRAFDLSQTSQLFIDEFPLGQNLSVHFYRNFADAQLEQNEIDSQTDYFNETPFSQLIYVRVESDDNGECFGIGPHLRLTVHPRPEFDVDQSAIFCLNGAPIILETFNPNTHYTYEWTDENGEIVSNLPTATITSGGVYTVVAISNQGCQSFQETFNIVESSIADIGEDDITVVDFSSNNSISINTENNNLGIGDYEFALDDIFGPFQDEPFFSSVGAGSHMLFVRDKNGCGTAQIEVFVLGFPKFFTPNNDGYHDTWNIEGWSNAFTQNSRIFIYNRYGKLIKQLSPWSDGWAGTFNGQKLRSTDYWFVAELVSHDGSTKILKGHFSLVR